MEREQLMRQLGLNIRKFRLMKDLSQEALSMSAGLYPAYVGYLERGEKCPTVDTLYKICEALEIPVSKILDFSPSEKLAETQAKQRIENAITSLTGSQQLKVAELVEKIVEMIDE